MITSDLDIPRQPDGAKAASATAEVTNTAGQMASPGPVLMPPRPDVSRRRSTLHRLSSFFPSLISPTSPDSNGKQTGFSTDSPVKEKQS
ncbi:hypothetical protein, partial [Erythrobacter sp. YJ-T3-07]|uniref:hypothetical protein n=1 Tax=Erythrobacter sp. YJ-T3-07 TaxID=2793063 RepID=UPI001F1D2DE2